jgi:hypothetical protein
MWDLYLGLAVMAGLSLVMLRLTSLVARQLSPWQRNLLATCIVVVMVLYSRTIWQNTLLADWLPFSNLVVVGNWFPLFLSALAGVVLEMPRLCLLRRGLVTATLLAFSSFALVYPLLGRTPVCGNEFSIDGEYVQSTPYTCSAASAANLLNANGIAATEKEMAELCLTRHGTSWLGLYRGLKLKTSGTKYDVQLVRCSPDELRGYADRPMILEVGLEEGTPVDATFRNEFGWAPGLRHSVVLRNFARGNANISDPSPHIGQEEWDQKTLALLWRGYALRLVEHR